MDPKKEEFQPVWLYPNKGPIAENIAAGVLCEKQEDYDKAIGDGLLTHPDPVEHKKNLLRSGAPDAANAGVAELKAAEAAVAEQAAELEAKDKEIAELKAKLAAGADPAPKTSKKK